LIGGWDSEGMAQGGYNHVVVMAPGCRAVGQLLPSSRSIFIDDNAAEDSRRRSTSTNERATVIKTDTVTDAQIIVLHRRSRPVSPN